MVSRAESAELAELASSRYLNYALSVITSRALPDVRDGLKPVQRRILYAMFHDLHLAPDARYKKSATVVGDVMGKYHPHGDQAIYDAMVRMAQDFSMRYALVDGHGNFGSLDGDPPAAMRYTEARLANIAMELLEELKQETVGYHPTFDATRLEPDVLPAQFPQLLVNGCAGIAVGMATSVPPHNLREVVSALVALIENRSLSVAALMKHVRGPDFPTGGMVLSTTDELAEIYRTGSGTIRVRGSWEPEKEGRRSFLVITSIPYALDKSALVARIGELIAGRQIPQLVDVRDESTEQVRVVCELKGGASVEAAAAYLYKHTPLQSNVHVNITCLVPGGDAGVAVPQRVALPGLLGHFLDFRLLVVTRRYEHQQRKLDERIHLLEGFEKIFADLDRAIRIVREAEGRPEAAAALKKAFALTDVQADAVLETKLYRLSRLEIKEIQTELKDARKRLAEVQKILKSEKMRWDIVRTELVEVSDAYGDRRRTQIVGPVREEEFREEEYIVDEDAWIVVTREGWIKRQKRFGDVASIRVREGDQVGWLYRGRARQCVTFFTSGGSAYTTRVDSVPMTAGHGEPLGRHFALGDGEVLVGVACHDPRCLPGPGTPPGAPAASPPPTGRDRDPGSGEGGAGDDGDEGGDAPPPGPYLLAVTRAGRTLRLPLSAHAEPSTKNGRLYCRLSSDFAGDQVIGAAVVTEPALVCVATRETRVLVFDAAQVPVLSGPGRGVIAIRLDEGDSVVASGLFDAGRSSITVETSRGTQTELTRGRHRVTSRAGKGHALLSRVQFVRQVPAAAVPVPDLSQFGDDDDGQTENGGGGGRD
jgi:DNA gyrase subunit A